MNSTLYAILRLYDYLLFVENLFSVRHCEVFLLSQLAPLSKLVVWERDYSPIDKDMYIYSSSAIMEVMRIDKLLTVLKN